MNDHPSTRELGTDPHRGLRLTALIAVVIGVAVLAAAAFVFSYAGIHQIALAAGVNRSLARLYPVMFDAMLVVAFAAALALRGAGWWTRCYVWLCTLVLLAAVAAGDAVRAMGINLPRKPAAAAVAVIPWVLLLLAFVFWLAMLRQLRRSRAAAAARGARPASGAGNGQGDRQATRLTLDNLLDPRTGAAAPSLGNRLAAGPAQGQARAALETAPAVPQQRPPAPQAPPAPEHPAAQPDAAVPQQRSADQAATTAEPAHSGSTPEPAPAGSTPEPAPAGSDPDAAPAGQEAAAAPLAPSPAPPAEPAAGEPAAEEPAAEEPVAEEPAASEPAASEPASGEPAFGEAGAPEEAGYYHHAADEDGEAYDHLIADANGPDDPSADYGEPEVAAPGQPLSAPPPVHFERPRSSPTPPEDEDPASLGEAAADADRAPAGDPDTPADRAGSGK